MHREVASEGERTLATFGGASLMSSPSGEALHHARARSPGWVLLSKKSSMGPATSMLATSVA